MIMENYSPSHPTDDMDIEDNDDVLPKYCTDNMISKDIEHKENVIVENYKPVDALIEGDLKEINDIESSAWNKELTSMESISSDIVNQSKVSKTPPRVMKRSRSKSVDKRSISKTGSKRSRSRSANKRSRSRNRRSRSKSGNRRHRSRSGARRSTSRSHSRNRRSRSRNRNSRNDSRNGNSRSFGRDKDTKRPKSRSKSPPGKVQVSNKDSRRNEPSINSRSPESRSILDRKDDNIFNKLTELRTLPTSDSPKEKWGCDSDEEATPTIVKPVQSSFPNNRGRNDNYGDRSFRDRQDSGDRRGRGFQRGAPWGTGRPNNRNDNMGERDSRNQQWGQTRQDYGNNRNITLGFEKNNDRVVSPIVKNTCDIEDESCDWGKKAGAIIDQPPISSTNQKSDREVKTDKFADNSDEEFGTWGKELKGDRSPARISAFDTDASQRVAEEPRVWGNDNNPRQRGPPPPSSNAREGVEGGFSAWKNSQKAETSKPLPATPDKFANNSDDEFGSWGNETKKVSVDKPTRNANDSDDECGAWNSEQRSTKVAINDDSFQECARDDEPFAADQRDGYHSRGGFNNNNNQYGQRRGGGSGGQRNFGGNTRFQRPPSQDRFYNNAQNYHHNDSSNSGGNGGGAYNNYGNNGPPPSQSQVPPMQPNYQYKPPQMPQWAAQSQANMSYPPRPVGQLPFPLDTSVCPPLNMMPPQMHQPPVPMMQHLPFIPPPPPNMSMEGRGPSLGSGAIMSMLGGQMASIGQPAINMGHNISMNQSAMGVGQSSNPSQSAMSMAYNANSGLSQAHLVAPSSIANTSNLLETLMTKAGLSSDSLRLDKKHDSSTMSVNDTFNSILKTAATSVISRLVESSNQKSMPPISDNMSMSPPSPPSNSPPAALDHVVSRYANKPATQQTAAAFVPPPLPNYSDILKSSTNKMANVVAKPSANTPDEEKRNRSDFDSKIDWQERVALEVKVFLKPAYMSRSIDKNDYKEIMKRCVTKITRSGVNEINSDKIEKFVLSYVDKYNKNRKVKQHSTVSSSEHDLRCD